MLVVMLEKGESGGSGSVTVIDCAALATPTPLVKAVKVAGEKVISAVPVLVEVLLEPPPQPARTTNEVRTTKRRTKTADPSEGILALIAPPPASGSREPIRHVGASPEGPHVPEAGKHKIVSLNGHGAMGYHPRALTLLEVRHVRPQQLLEVGI